jgi:hypothetical protein
MNKARVIRRGNDLRLGGGAKLSGGGRKVRRQSGVEYKGC